MLPHRNISPHFPWKNLFSISNRRLRRWLNILLGYWHADAKCHLKMTMNRCSVFLPRKRKTENLQAKGGTSRGSGPEERQLTYNHILLSLRDRTNLHMQLRLSLVSPRGSTHHLYGSAPSKLCYIRLQRSSPPCLSSLTLLLSQQHSAEKLCLWPQCQNTTFGDGMGAGLLDKPCVCIPLMDGRFL